MSCVCVPKVLLPKAGTDLSAWAVVACDQYTSQPEYWAETERLVGDKPSTLRLILPEVYLEDADVARRTEAIHESMRSYLADGTLTELDPGFILVSRTAGGAERKGLVVAIDLEAYSYKKGAAALVRPTEKTVEERIPPRLAVRRGACVEVPHIMVLIDDPEKKIIEPLFNEDLKPVYDTDLMQGGGRVRGWFVPEGRLTDRVISLMDGLMDREAFNKKYDLKSDLPLLNCVVGDGNHSLATAKAYWEEVKAGLTAEEAESHPARFCLCELVNIHDESLTIEPIHRVLFGASEEAVLCAASAYYGSMDSAFATSGAEDGDYVIPYCGATGSGNFIIKNPKWGTPLGALQDFLDDFAANNIGVKMDYIHGDEVTRDLGCRPGNMGFLLPALKKEELFRGVIIDGVLPRKSFSMGHANEKRFYLEAKKI